MALGSGALTVFTQPRSTHQLYTVYNCCFTFMNFSEYTFNYHACLIKALSVSKRIQCYNFSLSLAVLSWQSSPKRDHSTSCSLLTCCLWLSLARTTTAPWGRHQSMQQYPPCQNNKVYKHSSHLIFRVIVRTVSTSQWVAPTLAAVSCSLQRS